MMWSWHGSWWWVVVMPLGMLATWALVAWVVASILVRPPERAPNP